MSEIRDSIGEWDDEEPNRIFRQGVDPSEQHARFGDHPGLSHEPIGWNVLPVMAGQEGAIERLKIATFGRPITTDRLNSLAPKENHMNIWQRIAREPNAIAGVLLGAYGLLVAFEVLVLTATQFGAVTGFAGAVVILLRWLTTPAAEVVAQQAPGQVVPVAGPALEGVKNGDPVHVRGILGKA